MYNHQDESLLTAFHLMTPDERRFFLQTAQKMTRGRPIYKPKLVLVGGRSSSPEGRIFDGSRHGT